MASVVDLLTAGVRQLAAGRGQSAPADRAVQIVDFKSNKRAVLNEREIQRIIKQEDLPTVVVSIGGVARSGKSFLLNLLVNYLTYLEKHDSASGWETSNHPVRGVKWAQSSEAVTLGIWMWSKPFVIRRLDGERVAVLLMDCQGTGDNQRSDAKLDTLIMYISLQLSSFQLINIVNYLTSTELTSLQLCADYADIDEGSPTRGQGTHCHLFDNLIFVVRNCQHTKVFGEEPKLFQEIKKKCLNEELRRAMEGIEKAFKQITAFAFPYPGEDIAGASEAQKKWTLQGIPTRFLDPVKELATALFTSDRMAAEELPTGSQVLGKFKVLKIRLESTDLPEIGNSADALQETILYRAYSKADILYTETTGEVQGNLLSHKSEADLRKILASARDLALQVFCNEGYQHKYGHSIIWRKYEELFETNCDKHQYVLIVKYNQEIEMADLKRQMDEQTQQMDKKMDEKTRQMDEQTRLMDEKTRQMDDQTRQMNEQTRQMDEKTRQMDEKTHQMDEQTRLMDEQTQKSTKKIGKLESAVKETNARLEQAQKKSEMQQLEYQASFKETMRNSEAQLNKVTEKMEAARTFYERDIELQRRSTLLEEMAKTKAEVLALQEEQRMQAEHIKKQEKQERQERQEKQVKEEERERQERQERQEKQEIQEKEDSEKISSLETTIQETADEQRENIKKIKKELENKSDKMCNVM